MKAGICQESHPNLGVSVPSLGLHCLVKQLTIVILEGVLGLPLSPQLNILFLKLQLCFREVESPFKPGKLVLGRSREENFNIDVFEPFLEFF